MSEGRYHKTVVIDGKELIIVLMRTSVFEATLLFYHDTDEEVIHIDTRTSFPAAKAVMEVFGEDLATEFFRLTENGAKDFDIGKYMENHEDVVDRHREEFATMLSKRMADDPETMMVVLMEMSESSVNISKILDKLLEDMSAEGFAEKVSKKLSRNEGE